VLPIHRNGRVWFLEEEKRAPFTKTVKSAAPDFDPRQLDLRSNRSKQLHV
jgi:hypothetical protein